MILKFSIPRDRSAYRVNIGIVIFSDVYVQSFLNEDKSLIILVYFTVKDKCCLKICPI